VSTSCEEEMFFWIDTVTLHHLQLFSLKGATMISTRTSAQLRRDIKTQKLI